ncbi:MAG: hypothetical protein RLZ84_1240, partial [Actinomycetota bacterium]
VFLCARCDTCFPHLRNVEFEGEYPGRRDSMGGSVNTASALGATGLSLGETFSQTLDG